jgi:hypothetical protein
MNENTLNEILKHGKPKLMKLVPYPSNGPKSSLTSHDYNKSGIFEKNYPWYIVVNGLSGKLTDSKKRAKKMEWACDLTLEYLAELWIKQQGRCALTGVAMSFSAGSQSDKNPMSCSVDRIDNSLGYVKGNVRLLTHWANNTKSTWDNSIFETMISHASKHLELA